MAQQLLVGQGLVIFEASRSHSHTSHSVGLLWTSDQPDAETSTWQHTTLTRDRHPCPWRIRTHNPSKRTAANPRHTTVLLKLNKGKLEYCAVLNAGIPVATRPKASVCGRSLAVGFESCRGHGCLPLASVVCCHVEVSATGGSLIQRSPTEYFVSECDREASIMRRPWPTKGL